METRHRATELHLPHEITQYYFTCHPTQVNAPTLTPARQAGVRFTYPRGMEDWVDLGDWLYTEIYFLIGFQTN